MDNRHIPAVSLSATVDKPRINPGGHVRIGYFIFTTTPIPSHKFIVYVPPAIVSGKIEVRTFSYGTQPGMATPQPVCPQNVATFATSPFTVKFHEYYFAERIGSNLPTLNSEGNVNCDGVEYPPVEVAFTIPTTAPTGDHLIVTRLAYEHQGTGGIAQTEATVHINTFGERNHNVLMGLLTALLAGGPFLYSVLPASWQMWLVGLAAWVTIVILLLLRE